MYEPNCGLSKVYISWGHDEYMYQMLKHNKCTLPEEGLYIIRYVCGAGAREGEAKEGVREMEGQ